MSVLDQIQALEEQKKKLMADAKAEALEAAHKAVDTLNQLGFNYRLVETGTMATPSRTSTKRRSGVREEVIKTVADHPKGISRAEVLEVMGVKGDKSGEQSVSNALSNAKKKGDISLVDGVYKFNEAS